MSLEKEREKDGYLKSRKWEKDERMNMMQKTWGRASDEKEGKRRNGNECDKRRTLKDENGLA